MIASYSPFDSMTEAEGESPQGSSHKETPHEALQALKRKEPAKRVAQKRILRANSGLRLVAQWYTFPFFWVWVPLIK